MRFEPLALEGAWLISPQRHADQRGWFARTFCRDEFAAHGLSIDFVQSSTSFNHLRGTLRGLHYQHAPYAEAKLVRCTRGALFDVLLDLRPGSTSFRRWCSVTLTADAGTAVYVPPGCAHGFQTLQDDTEVLYQMSERYAAAAADGLYWDDPAFAIAWPIRPPILSKHDANLPCTVEGHAA